MGLSTAAIVKQGDVGVPVTVLLQDQYGDVAVPPLVSSLNVVGVLPGGGQITREGVLNPDVPGEVTWLLKASDTITVGNLDFVVSVTTSPAIISYPQPGRWRVIIEPLP